MRECLRIETKTEGGIPVRHTLLAHGNRAAGKSIPQTASCRKEDHKTGHKAKSQLLYRLRENDDELGALQQSTRNVSGLRASSLPYHVGLALVEPCQSEKVLVIAETWTIHEDLHRRAFIC